MKEGRQLMANIDSCGMLLLRLALMDFFLTMSANWLSSCRSRLPNSQSPPERKFNCFNLLRLVVEWGRGVDMKSWTGLGLVVALAGCGGVPSGPVTDQEMAQVVREINREGAEIFADEFPGMTGQARLDPDNILVLMLVNTPTGKRTYDPNALRRLLRPQICEDGNFRRLIDNGWKVRLEMTSNMGSELPAIQFARC